MTTLRAATMADVPRLRAIEISAGRVFAEIGMEAIARDEPRRTRPTGTPSHADRSQ